MQKYCKPEIEVIEIGNSDIVTQSGELAENELPIF